MESMRQRGDWPKSVQPFERFSEAVDGLAEIAGFEYESDNAVSQRLGPLALAALAFSIASRYRGLNGSKNEYFLSEAIRHAPEEAVPYYFRAKWRHMSSLIEKLDTNLHSDQELATWVADLEIAINLSPSWQEPKAFLDSLRSPRQSSE